MTQMPMLTIAMALALSACQAPSEGFQNGQADVTGETKDADADRPGESVEREPLVGQDESYRAGGTEPFWSLQITPDAIVYDPMDGDDLRITDFTAKATPAGWLYRGGDLTADIDMSVDQCSDGMSDIRYRHAVTLTIGGEARRGCGGGPLPAGALNNTGWRVAAINGQPVDIERDNPGAAHISFANGLLSGNVGCNSFGGVYLTGDTWLATADLAATEMACAAPIMENERIALELLRGHANLENGDGGQLVISDGHYQMTLYPSACERCDDAENPIKPALQNSWRLSSLNQEPIGAAETGYDLTFDGNRFTASAGCNRISGSYSADEDTIRFGQVISTRKACPSDAGRREAAFLRAIAEPLTYRITAEERLFLASRTVSLLYVTKE